MPYYNLKLSETPIKQAISEDTYLTAGIIGFSTEVYWIQGEDSIDMNDSRNLIQQYITAYKNTLEELGVEGIEVRAAKYSELTANGVIHTMINPGRIGEFWTTSGHPNIADKVWYISESGFVYSTNYNEDNYKRGVRPIIIIPK